MSLIVWNAKLGALKELINSDLHDNISDYAYRLTVNGLLNSVVDEISKEIEERAKRPPIYTVILKDMDQVEPRS